ncbi:MAG: Glu-tRNA(Gln) amidotransferase subunit GatE [Bacteroidales bacterium]|nr:Glu-tRNA(Gln) amidotransferase subunit GatE [Candidatus Latescibacterota bacterium]
MVEPRRMEDLTLEDYQAIGMKSGLEIHQQLDTEKKLFCRCPIKPYSDVFDAEILRHMRPTLSELGEYDGTALMEFKTRKNVIYQINQQTICTYEMDDNPPFELNQQALDIALEVTMLLNCKLVSEVHIARKQYLDGSIPAGFQRTTILGVDGSIPYGDREIGIIQLGLEEDACREVSDTGHTRVYRTDRLGIPLIETVTLPEMRTPQEVADVAQILRYLVRSTGKVRTGLGATRQDVNVSVARGQRVEIKGVPRIPDIPFLVHNEAFRQVALIEIMDELKKRGIDHDSFEYTSIDVTDILKDTEYAPAAEALQEKLKITAVVLKGYEGILNTWTQPETIFAREISDRVRVIACLDRLPNIAHSDMEGETFSSKEWARIKKQSGCGKKDVVILVWGGGEDLETAVKEIAIRAKDALDGVCDETRQALPDGTTGFERILPGPNRMYPDTDLPPLAITKERIDRIRNILPEKPWERRSRYVGIMVHEFLAQRMSISPSKTLFDRLTEQTDFEPNALASLLLDKVRRMNKRNLIPGYSDETLETIVVLADKKKLPVESLPCLVRRSCGETAIQASEAVETFETVDEKTLASRIKKFLDSGDLPDIAMEKLVRFSARGVMEKFCGMAPGARIMKMIEKALS